MENKKKIIREWAVSIAVGLAIALVLKFFILEVYFVEGQSMENSFQQNDILFGEKISYRVRLPHYGDVVVLKLEKGMPNADGKKIIKRVVGLPGDTVSVKDGFLYRNGQKVSETYIKEKMNENFPAVTVKPDHVFVMGDNRNNSADSRYFGQFQLRSIQGRVFFELFNNPFKFY